MNPRFFPSLLAAVAIGLPGLSPAADAPAFPNHLSTEFRQGDVIESGDAPDCADRAFRVSGRVVSGTADGVLASQGGVINGWALTIEEGRLVASIRREEKLHRFAAKDPAPGEGFAFRFELLAGGEASLFMNDQRVAGGNIGGLLPVKPGDPLIIGADSKAPVGNYQSPFKFPGKISGVTVALAAPVARPQSEMKTRWAADVTPDSAWAEYPRPQLRRDQWTNLNGLWDYAVTDQEAVVPADGEWDGKILVPFAIESQLSGVRKSFSPQDALWYRRSVTVSKKGDRRYLLNFEAVDYRSTLWVNDREIGSHIGGNLPFSFDITEALKDGDNTLILRVTDATDAKGAYQLHGKQRLDPKGIWYTPVSGIWQTVWMEEVPANHVTSIRVTAKIDGTVSLEVPAQGAADITPVRVEVSLGGETVATAEGTPLAVPLKIAEPRLWSPESPTLYDLEIRYGDDVVHSYFGIRENGIEKDADGHLRFTLNGREIFPWGTLDQGWWPDGLLTPPSDEAMLSDIEFLKAAGFNTIRKHIKVEPRRYYWHCDRLGMMVWQDQVSSMSDNPKWTRLQSDPEEKTWPEAAHAQFMAELREMMDGLHSHPSITQWVPFNEAWGQHQTLEVVKWVVEYDPTRTVNAASGGNWYPAGHIVDEHRYPHPGFPFELGEGGRFDGYVKVVGEFGGHGFPVEGHVWDPGARNWGYGGLPKDKDEWLERYRESIRLLAELRKQGIAAGIYTQTTDVEGEINGLITYDRAVPKLAAEPLREIHRAAGFAP